MYTDTSKTDGKIGLVHTNLVLKFLAISDSSVYSAEAFGILKAIDNINENTHEHKNISILTHSLSA